MLIVGCAAEGSLSNVDDSKQTGTESTEGSQNTKEINTNKKAGQLELIEWNIEIGEYDIMSVVGIVENNTARDFDFGSITFGIYDAAGFKLGEANDIQALRAGEKWNLKQ
jgi:hypothetical protein